MNDDFPIKITDTRIVYENPWIRVREDTTVREDGSKGIYGYLEVGDSVVVVAANDDGDICLVESYRHPVKKWCWELPGGGGDGDDPAVAAQRELVEETGITATDWQVLGKGRVCNGLSTEYQYNVLATEITITELIEREGETRAQKFVPLAELEHMIAAGEFEDNQSIVAIYMYKNWLQSQ